MSASTDAATEVERVPMRPLPELGVAHLDPRAAEAWTAMHAAFQRARAEQPARSRSEPPDRYAFCGGLVIVQAVGEALRQVVRKAWAHLADDGVRSAPDASPLRVELWDTRESGVAAPGIADGFDDPERPYRVSREVRYVGHRQPRTLAWLDRRERRLVVAGAGVAELSTYEIGRPLETLLLVWLRDRRVQLVHGALVAEGNRAALIVGQSGAGKSTCATACLCAGLSYLGDDKLGLLRDPSGDFVGHSLTSSLHLCPGHLERFPALAPHALPGRSGPDDKVVVLLSEQRPEQLRRTAPIRAVVVPRIAARPDTTVRRISKREALFATALSTMFHLPIERARTLETLGQLVERLPAYRLELGSDLTTIAPRVRELLAAG